MASNQIIKSRAILKSRLNCFFCAVVLAKLMRQGTSHEIHMTALRKEGKEDSA